MYMLSKNMFFLRGDFNGYDRIYCIYKENNNIKINFESTEFICTNNIDMVFNCICDKRGVIYILSRNIYGDIILTQVHNMISENSTIFKRNKNIENSYFYFDIVNNIPVLIYTISDTKKGQVMLMYTCFENKTWKEPQFIDRILMQSNIKFGVLDIKNEHKLIYYKNTNGNIIGREILLYPFVSGTPFEYIKNGNYVTDISVLAYDGKVHIVYILALRGRMGVYYKCKDDYVSNAKTIWEGRFADNVIMYQNNDELCVLWQTLKGIMKYEMSCENINKIYSNSQSIVKCRYKNTNEKGKILANECYGLVSIKGKIPIFPEENNDFYIKGKVRNTMETTEKRLDFDNINILVRENQEKEQEIIQLSEELKKIYEKYQNLFESYQKEKGLIKSKINEMDKKEKDYEYNINILKKENYQLNNIIEDIMYSNYN